MSERKTYWTGDTLLDPQEHPADTRLLLSHKSNNPEPYEVTILEWAPSGNRVKVQYAHGGQSWVECEHYTPVVIEVLP